jgi:CxxC-x17-CxxC domain-containing protein
VLLKIKNCDKIIQMNDFKRSNRGGRTQFGDRKRFGDKPSFNRGRGGRPSQLFPAVCSECGMNCEVPFRPTGDKPVYCLKCFNNQSHQSHAPSRNFSAAPSPRFEAPSPVRTNDAAIDALKREMSVMQSKLDQILAAVNKKPEVPPQDVAAPAPKKEKVKKATKPKKK